MVYPGIFFISNASVFIYSASQIKRASLNDMNFGASGSLNCCDHSRTITPTRTMNTVQWKVFLVVSTHGRDKTLLHRPNIYLLLTNVTWLFRNFYSPQINFPFRIFIYMNYSQNKFCGKLLFWRNENSHPPEISAINLMFSKRLYFWFNKNIWGSTSCKSLIT